MTIPVERYRALRMADEFLTSLLDPKKTPRVPKDIRRQAAVVLRHYPTRYERILLARAAQKDPRGSFQGVLLEADDDK